MASNSRGVLLLGGGAMIAAAAIISTTSGKGWIIPMAIFLSIILSILLFSTLTSSTEKTQGSTPLSVRNRSNSQNIDTVTEDLPDPSESGIELPIL
jgi:sensor domain CHASE-containing protein